MAEETVGPILGPQSEMSAEATVGYTPDGTAWDYAIGGIPFMDASSDERPYARETAQFRKEQFDSSRSVGDQSLSGYWTRGQLSFHKGAGVNFYEVLDGETILDRFTDALDVDTWTPGRVTVKAERTQLVADSCSYGFLHDGGFATISAAGVVKSRPYTAGAGTTLAPTAGTAASLASDGTNLYIAVQDRIEKRAPGGAFATLRTHHTGGRTFSQVFVAKSRLWAFDDIGQLFMLPLTTTGATAGGDIIWNSTLGTGWSVADSPGGVFFANKNLVYETVLSQTDVPSVPTVVASLGAQETIGAIGAYLGYLVVASSKGIRMGRIGGSNSLALALGDLLVAADGSACRGLSFRDSLVLVTATVGSTTFLYEVNVLDQIEDLSGAYAPVRSLGSATVHSSLVFPDGRTVTMSEDGVTVDDASLGDGAGYVTTGFHRFGTLEPKDFRSVSVYASGTAGTITVSLVRRDGATSSLVTLGPSNFASNEIALNLPAATDYIGLRFDLAAENDVSPVLLGYQLRAMPAPTRQRLIQIPLQCFDIERVGTVYRGKKGGAWIRLSALEDMERSSGVVRYQDLNTGEVGQVLVEQVQFQKRTPPKNKGATGWGGYIMLTVRKVA